MCNGVFITKWHDFMLCYKRNSNAVGLDSCALLLAFSWAIYIFFAIIFVTIPLMLVASQLVPMIEE